MTWAHADSAATFLRDTSLIIINSSIDSNDGGNGNNGWGSGGVAIMLMAVDGAAMLFNTSIALIGVNITNNFGGSENAGMQSIGEPFNGGAGALLLLHMVNAGSSATMHDNRLLMDRTFISGNEGGQIYLASSYADGTNTHIGGVSILALVGTYALQSVAVLQQHAIAISGCTFDGNVGTAFNALYFVTGSMQMIFNNNSLSISNSTFDNTQANGALVVMYIVLPTPVLLSTAHNALILEDVQFVNGSGALGSGMAIVSNFPMDGDITNVSMIHVDFMNNRAFCGSTCCCNAGALLMDNVDANISDARFNGNSATYAGGAILTQGTASLHCHRCSFHDNHADVLGDIIVIQSSKLSVFTHSQLYMLGGTLLSSSIGISASFDKLLFGIATQLLCPPGNQVHRAANAFSCVYCPPNQYLLDAGVWYENDTQPINSCMACEYGGDCSLGGAAIVAALGYYGTKVEQPINNEDSWRSRHVRRIMEDDAPLPFYQSSVQFTLCPNAQCCSQSPSNVINMSSPPSSSSSCDSYNACHAYRTGRLCSQCVADYSEVLGSSSCASNEHCYDMAWFLPLMLLLGTMLAAFFLLQGANSKGTINVLAYYYQLTSTTTSSMMRMQSPCPLLMPCFMFACVAFLCVCVTCCACAGFMQLSSLQSNDSALDYGLSNFVTQFLQLQPTGGVKFGVCILNISAIGEQFIYLLIPLCILIPFIAMISILYVSHRRQCSSNRHGHMEQSQSHNDAAAAADDDVLAQPSLSLCSIRWCSALPGRLHHLILQRNRGASIGQICLIGLIRIGLFTYSIVIAHILVLLHCVPVHGDMAAALYIFRAAYTSCYQPWQYALIIAVIGLLAAPLMLAYAMYQHHQRRQSQRQVHAAITGDHADKQRWSHSSSPSSSSAVAAVQDVQLHELSQSPSALTTSPILSSLHLSVTWYDVLCSPYNSRYYYWECVLLLYRMVVVLIGTFVLDAITCLLLLSCVNLLALIGHAFLQPFLSSRVQAFQLLCIALLSIIAALSVPQATLATNATTALQTNINDMLNACNIAQTICILLPIALLGMAYIAIKTGCTRWVSNGCRRRWGMRQLDGVEQTMDKQSVGADSLRAHSLNAEWRQALLSEQDQADAGETSTR